MLQGIERKQETSQIKTTVTAMFHDSAVEFSGQVSFRVRMSVVPRSFLRVVIVVARLIDQSSLSRNLTGKPVISARWLRLRLRRASLPQSKLFSAETRLALFSFSRFLQSTCVSRGRWLPEGPSG